MRSNERIDRIVIIGGGISGLSSAFYVLRQAEEQGRRVEVTLVEAGERLGGLIHTLRKGDFVIEQGPDSFLARKQPIIDLTRELGLEDELATQGARQSFIVHEGRLHPMPQGLVLGIPTDIDAFLATELVSEAGKQRALEDLELPARPLVESGDDESIGDFLDRRFGAEVTERLAEPLLAGIYAGELRQLSLQATFPQFRQVELQHGSLIRGMQASRQTPPASGEAKPSPAIQTSVFLSYKRGLSTLVEGLDAALQGIDRRLGSAARAIEPQSGAAAGAARYVVRLANGDAVDADAIVLTVPTYASADLLEPLVDARELREMQYASVANIVLGFDKAAFGRELEGSGFVVPRDAGYTITACTWTSAKWTHTAPQDKVLIRCYVGHAGEDAIVGASDEAITARVREDLQALMGIETEPEFVELTRLSRSMPQYSVGHVQRMAELRSRLAERLPGVWATGMAFDGVGIPDCVRQGKEAAAAVLAELAAVRV
ncbi:protoporphyrinogen oxidase [Paenibacillus sp. 598K]|uniref:protoporphyrinogen oxidase n=1 Tax=Paenibacillus sp. 598K TaxID=1117987 RepID=UPI000FFA5DF2|nr:protoporphyrinogen oxidase [Paenibacillus sp. 598K]GBF72867.1 protoporphyrinogen oxidase [Paenibacillus sp. 598K]